MPRALNFPMKDNAKKHALFLCQGLPRPLLAVLRLLYAALITTDLIWVGLDHPQGQWIIHFINWSRVFVGLYFLMGAITQLHPSLCRSKDTDHYDKIKQPGERLDHSFVSAYDSTSCGLTPGEEEDNWGAGKNRLSWYHEVLWVLHTIAADTSFVCTVAYFSLFFEQRYTWDGLLDIPRHVLYLLFMIIDTLCCYIPVRLLHVVYANIFGAAYIVFTLIFLLTEVKADLRLNPIIYPSLESENKPLLYTAYLSIFLIGCFPVSQAFFFLLYKFRAWVTST